VSALTIKILDPKEQEKSNFKLDDGLTYSMIVNGVEQEIFDCWNELLK